MNSFKQFSEKETCFYVSLFLFFSFLFSFLPPLSSCHPHTDLRFEWPIKITNFVFYFLDRQDPLSHILFIISASPFFMFSGLILQSYTWATALVLLVLDEKHGNQPRTNDTETGTCALSSCHKNESGS